MSERRLVLIVDDDETIRQFVEWALSEEGYEVAGAPDGAAALGLLTRGRPDLILLDLRMPGMDGWAFARAYRERPGPHAPIAVMTASREGHNPASEVGATEFLAKPFDLDDLLALVERLAGGADAARA